METLVYDNLALEIYTDETYSPGSVDNVHKYIHVYNTCIGKSSNYNIAKYGIRIVDGERVTNSAILIADIGGATLPHARSQLIVNDKLVLLIGYYVCSLTLPDLTLHWQTKCENCGTCFEIYKFAGSYIVHGELSVFKISLNGIIEWERFGRDIFTTLSGEKDFQVFNDHIEAKDWLGYTYKFDKDGNLI